MLSILIPIYNFNTLPLVKILQEQAEKISIPYEIICLNDASTQFLDDNKKMQEIPNVRYEFLNHNIGRSKIRNLLARQAQYDWLLFVDADIIPKSDQFIANYVAQINHEIKAVNGGIIYSENKPEQNKLLRWVYGKSRESLPVEARNKNPYLSFLTLNFLIHKSIFEKIRFDETIPNLRHEDTLFSYTLKQHNVAVKHIDNPVYHIGLDNFENAMRKENESLYALKNLLDQQLLPPDYIKISKVFSSLKKMKMVYFMKLFHDSTRFIFQKNLASAHPSLFIFDLYRLGYLCKLDTQN